MATAAAAASVAAATGDPGDTVRFAVTVPIGCEAFALDEARQHALANATILAPGVVQLTADQTIAGIDEWIQRLRIVDHFAVVLYCDSDVSLKESGADELAERFSAYVASSTGRAVVQRALAAWRALHPACGPRPAFASRSFRKGKHAWRSPRLEAGIGAAFFDHLAMPVNLKQPDITVWTTTNASDSVVTLRLTDADFAWRYRAVRTGPTNLLPSIAATMVAVSGATSQSVVLDPMGGGATTVIEAMLAGKALAAISADIHQLDTQRASRNAASAGVPVEVVRWNAKWIPMRSACIDVVLCDMPFGKRCGTARQNQKVYPRVLREVERLVRPGGRIVLLTTERSLIRIWLRDRAQFVRQEAMHLVDNGGLETPIYIVDRTDATWVAPRGKKTHPPPESSAVYRSAAKRAKQSQVHPAA